MMCAEGWHVPHEVAAAGIGLDDIFQKIQIRPIVLIVAAGVGGREMNVPFAGAGVSSMGLLGISPAGRTSIGASVAQCRVLDEGHRFNALAQSGTSKPVR
jgi:hypothetical protein